MATWRIGGSIYRASRGLRGFRGRLRFGSTVLCAFLLLAALAVAGVGLCHVHAQSTQSSQSSSQTGQQSGSQANSQAGAQPDTSSDADSNLNDPPPVLPTDPPGWKPEASSTDAPAATPAQPPASKSAPVPSAQTEPAPASAPPSDAPKPADAIAAAPAKPAAAPLPTDPHQRQVAVECADLLQMATDLKSAVDKSTKDELSVDVVRKAGEIEQYARKVRAGTQMTAGKQ
jgi:hypothetical protein